MLFQERMHLEPRFKTDETPYLPLGQGTRPVAFHGNDEESRCRRGRCRGRGTGGDGCASVNRNPESEPSTL